jgi:hypothetical protein
VDRLRLDTDNAGRLCYKLEGRIVRNGDEIEMWQIGGAGWKAVTFKWTGNLDDLIELSDGLMTVSYGPSGTFRWPRSES